MNSSIRTGINERWANGWKTTLRHSDAWHKTESERQEQDFRFYIAHGEKRPGPGTVDVPPTVVIPPLRTWEDAYVEGNFRVFAELHVWRWERAAIVDGRFDADAIATMFASEELAELVALDMHTLAHQRFAGLTQPLMNPSGFYCSALAFVAGPRAAGQELARMQLAALRRGCYDPRVMRPTAAFIARLFADWLQQPPVAAKGDPMPLSKGEIAADPVLAALWQVWRQPDAAQVADACLAALDVHTYLASPGRDSYRREFTGTWSRTPIAVLLVLRMRELLGLQIPVLDHPLMIPVMASLPSESQGTVDPLIAMVRARMERDGFDPAPIRRAYQN